MDADLIKDIKDDYIIHFLGTQELAKKYNLNRSTIQRYLKKEKVSLRKRTPKTKVNHFFFSEYNEKSCYWAGFLLADGYIRTNKRFTIEVKLQKKDLNHLEKLKMDLLYEGNIKERDLYFNLSISSSQLIKDLLNNFEITTKKSFTCFISKKIPKIFLKDFIRGYFDGDGSITFTSIDTINLLGTYKTVNFIRNYFYEIGIKLRSKDKPNIVKLENIFQINYSGKSAFKCLNELYKNSNVYLDRKYNKYKSLISKYN